MADDYAQSPTGAKVADIALLLEGTYPYVSGGVSSWVHQIIRGLPEFTFSLIFMGGSAAHYGEKKYQLPQNVIHLSHHYLMESWKGRVPRARVANPRPFEDSAKLHDAFRAPEVAVPEEALRRVMEALGQSGGLSREDFLYSENSWDQVCDSYQRYCTDPSFVDYFWTVRTMHAPLFILADIAAKMPPARVFHAISTGYAGFLGSLLRRRRNRPFILTEHGIYTKERKIDLAQAEWIADARGLAFDGGLEDSVSYIRRLWIRFFESIGRMTYASADPIISLYEGNRARQLKDGAIEARTQVVPNGIDLERFAALRAKRTNEVPKVLGLIGRVVPIKGIKTFIAAMRTVCSVVPGAEGWIIGPSEEDEAYGRECKDMVSSLGLEGRVKFLGFRKVDEVLPQLGLVVLTSISEAQPLVILEAYAAGVPALATDVGSCRELIEGRTQEDRALGHAGAVVPIADPEATARAGIALLTDNARWHRAQEAGIRRVSAYYTQRQMFDTYRAIYQKVIAQ